MNDELAHTSPAGGWLNTLTQLATAGVFGAEHAVVVAAATLLHQLAISGATVDKLRAVAEVLCELLRKKPDDAAPRAD
jgi:hypothetical protein